MSGNRTHGSSTAAPQQHPAQKSRGVLLTVLLCGVSLLAGAGLTLAALLTPAGRDWYRDLLHARSGEALVAVSDPDNYWSSYSSSALLLDHYYLPRAIVESDYLPRAEIDRVLSEKDFLAKISEMQEANKDISERINGVQKAQKNQQDK